MGPGSKRIPPNLWSHHDLGARVTRAVVCRPVVHAFSWLGKYVACKSEHHASYVALLRGEAGVGEIRPFAIFANKTAAILEEAATSLASSHATA